jgi:nitronate monooxygenase
VRNAFTQAWEGDPDGLRQRPDLHAAYAKAAAQGNAEIAPPIAGEAVGLIQDTPGAAEIVTRMAREAEELITGGWRR